MGYEAYGKGGGKGMNTQDQECLEHKNQGHCYKAREGWCRYGHWGASGQRLNLEEAGRGSTRSSNGPSGKGGKGGNGVFRDDEEEAKKDGPPMLKDLQEKARTAGLLDVLRNSGAGGVDARVCAPAGVVDAWMDKENGKVLFVPGALDRMNFDKAQVCARYLSSRATKNGKEIGDDMNEKNMDTFIKLMDDGGIKPAEFKQYESAGGGRANKEKDSQDLEDRMVRMFGALLTGVNGAGVNLGRLANVTPPTAVSPKRKKAKGKENAMPTGSVFGAAAGPGPFGAGGAAPFGSATTTSTSTSAAATGGTAAGPATGSLASRLFGGGSQKEDEESESDLEAEESEEETDESEYVKNVRQWLDILEGLMETALKGAKGRSKKNLIVAVENNELVNVPPVLLGPGPGQLLNGWCEAGNNLEIDMAKADGEAVKLHAVKWFTKEDFEDAQKTKDMLAEEWKKYAAPGPVFSKIMNSFGLEFVGKSRRKSFLKTVALCIARRERVATRVNAGVSVEEAAKATPVV